MREWTIGELFSQSFADFKKNVGLWIALLFTFVGGSLIIDIFQPQEKSWIISIISWIFSSFVQFLMLRAALAGARGENILATDIFSRGQLFVKYIVLSILIGLVTFVGFILLIVPGIYLTLALSVATYILVDRNVKCIEAFTESMKLTEGHLWHILGLMIAILFLNVLGVLLVGLGLLVTIPMSILSMAHLYLILSGDEQLVEEESVEEETSIEQETVEKTPEQITTDTTQEQLFPQQDADFTDNE